MISYAKELLTLQLGHFKWYSPPGEIHALSLVLRSCVPGKPPFHRGALRGSQVWLSQSAQTEGV